MAKTDTLHIRVAPDVKSGVESTLNQLGLSTTEAVNIFLNQVMLTGGLPFPVQLPHQPNAETIAAMKEADRISRDTNVKGFLSVEELFKELNS